MGRRGGVSGNGVVIFKDFFPDMLEKLGVKGFIKELRCGFGLLMDKEKGVITAESLRKNMRFFGLVLEDEEVMWMVREGDLDGDGALSEAEFFILMIKLSPGFMHLSSSFFHQSHLDRKFTK
ncbi:calcium-binding protein PBP1 [Cucumis melo var. makuwa]|uniref:Calcium-binding protein PBP1 n=1 Tax=Cucumis melo var. makuwa TaxID=1194695 RepID=A0A5A7UNY8_CUCMM|nr:calcium-binding protein PBP1 [Cucumis melo var. makuwa]TYK26362.1 calcium-binding protein PBP1 [Cucumis melo var. makuwa]